MLGNPIVSTSIHDEDEVMVIFNRSELIFEKWNNKVDLVIDKRLRRQCNFTIIDLTGYEPEVVREGKGEFGYIIKIKRLNHLKIISLLSFSFSNIS